MNWSGCPNVETVPGKVSGAPVIKGTRLPAQTVLDNFDAGVDKAEIAAVFEVPVEDVRTVIAHAKRVLITLHASFYPCSSVFICGSILPGA